jgi:hypothetical protein
VPATRRGSTTAARRPAPSCPGPSHRPPVVRGKGRGWDKTREGLRPEGACLRHLLMPPALPIFCACVCEKQSERPVRPRARSAPCPVAIWPQLTSTRPPCARPNFTPSRCGQGCFWKGWSKNGFSAHNERYALTYSRYCTAPVRCPVSCTNSQDARPKARPAPVLSALHPAPALPYQGRRLGGRGTLHWAAPIMALRPPVGTRTWNCIIRSSRVSPGPRMTCQDGREIVPGAIMGGCRCRVRAAAAGGAAAQPRVPQPFASAAAWRLERFLPKRAPS